MFRRSTTPRAPRRPKGFDVATRYTTPAGFRPCLYETLTRPRRRSTDVDPKIGATMGGLTRRGAVS
jgi:hypothetical protein